MMDKVVTDFQLRHWNPICQFRRTRKFACTAHMLKTTPVVAPEHFCNELGAESRPQSATRNALGLGPSSEIRKCTKISGVDRGATRCALICLSVCLSSGPSWPFLSCSKLGPDNNTYLAQIITPQNGIFFAYKMCWNTYVYSVFNINQNLAKMGQKKTITFHILQKKGPKKRYFATPPFSKLGVFFLFFFLVFFWTQKHWWWTKKHKLKSGKKTKTRERDLKDKTRQEIKKQKGLMNKTLKFKVVLFMNRKQRRKKRKRQKRNQKKQTKKDKTEGKQKITRERKRKWKRGRPKKDKEKQRETLKNKQKCPFQGEHRFSIKSKERKKKKNKTRAISLDP